MSDFFIGEIRMFSFGIVPYGWHLCDGSILPIQQNSALFALLGTQFGGNGTSTFGLPDLRGRVPLGTQIPGQQQGAVYAGGAETVVLTTSQMPAHNHNLQAIAATPGDKSGPAAHFYAKVAAVSPATAPVNIYGAPTSTNLTPLDSGAMSGAGGNSAHPNIQPFLVGNYCIATTGIFPTRW